MEANGKSASEKRKHHDETGEPFKDVKRVRIFFFPLNAASFVCAKSGRLYSPIYHPIAVLINACVGSDYNCGIDLTVF